MEAIYIPQLAKALDGTEVLEVREHLPDLQTLMPVQGKLKVKHCGNYLEVSARVETIITLTCDRCLQQYNHRLKLKTRELIWLEASPEEPGLIPLEREVSLEELVETLPPQGYFDPATWLYEQLCLELPHRQLCDRACPGIAPSEDRPAEITKPVDRRWASLEALKNQLP
ncbi:MAG: YceD family protein [Desertifilum sp.]|nr:YceD family protein [Desertifilum sp.]